ncbi:MAG: rod shape-determining protein MreC [Armatimonadetes bacterium]|nr:rod shape-determining protein MreC [Armatimonadota bacterium]
MQNRARNQGHSDPVTVIVRSMTSPASRALDDFGIAWNGAVTNLFQGAAVKRELARLRQLEAAVSQYEDTVQNLEKEVSSLRALQSMPNFGRKRIGARITGYFPYANRATLSVGSKDGIVAGMPVVCAQGLLGIVQTVDADTSQFYSVTSPHVIYGGRVDAQVPVPGLVKGQTPTRLVLDVWDNGNVKVGDPVVTSGYGDRIPAGIPVGTVVEVVPDPSYGTRRIYVAPSAQFGPILEVWVLK